MDGAEHDALFDRAMALSDAGDEASAEPLFALLAEAGSVEARYDQGNALWRLGRQREAAVALRGAGEAGEPSAWLNLGLVLEELDDAEGAVEAYERAQDVGDPRAAAFRGRLLWTARGRNEGEPVLRAAVALGDPHAASALSGLLEQDGGTDEVAELFRMAAAVDEDARTDLGRFLRRRGRLAEAEQVLRKEVVWGNADASIALALLLEEDRDDGDGAERVLRDAAANGELHAHNNLGTLLWARGELLGAQDQFQLGARGGDATAARNLRSLRRDERRQLNRAWRRRLRATSVRELVLAGTVRQTGPLLAALDGADEDDLRDVLALLSHLDPAVRRSAVTALTDLVPEPVERPDVVDAVRTLTTDLDARVRDYACFVLGEQWRDLDTPAVRDALTARLMDPDTETRCEALLGLAHRRDPRALPHVRAALQLEHPWLLELRAAGALGDPSLHPLVLGHRDGWAGDGDVADAVRRLTDPAGPGDDVLEGVAEIDRQRSRGVAADLQAWAVMDRMLDIAPWRAPEFLELVAARLAGDEPALRELRGSGLAQLAGDYSQTTPSPSPSS